MDKQKEYALITGASSGIGAEFAILMARKGINLVLTARREEKLKELSEQINKISPVDVKLFPIDLSNSDSPQRIYEFCQANRIGIDYLINNAGFGKKGDFIKIPWGKESEMIDLNVKSLVALSKLFGTEMVNRGKGRIMNVASTASFVPGPRWAIYFASKAFVLSFSEAIAAEFKPYGVTVTTLCPGPTQSEFGIISGAEKVGATNPSVPTSKEVASFGLKAMMKGKGVVVHGCQNRFIANFVSRVTPRTILAKQVFARNK